MHDNFKLEHTLHLLEHHLPSQAPLKDFIHHNTLHAFQNQHFHDGLRSAQTLFGYQVYAPFSFYREQYKTGAIHPEVLDRILEKAKETDLKDALLHKNFDENTTALIGSYRSSWKSKLGFDLDTRVHPLLFRLVSSYLDQGIAIWNFPADTTDFLTAFRSLESLGITSLFESKRARNLFLDESTALTDLLHILVGDSAAFEAYLLDQQFAHPGYSGMVCQLQNNPNALVHKRQIKLTDLIFLECLLEISALDQHFGTQWKTPTACQLRPYQVANFNIPNTQLFEVKALWQEAFEWSFYDQVLAGLQFKAQTKEPNVTAQAVFCIDDRECSIRRHLEIRHPSISTFGTPGHFNIEAYFQPDGAVQRTKICPAPVQPRHLIMEKALHKKRNKELHFSAQTYGLVFGWILTHTYGLWSALKLALAIFKPSLNRMAVRSSEHMQPDAHLSILHEGMHTPDGLQIGFTVEEMTRIVGSLLKSIGLQDHFAPLVYMIAHGSSSANNTHYAGYDCGACSGRPGSVNARAIAYMANHPLVRLGLQAAGIHIAEHTHFVPILHDTCRDEMIYYDLEQVPVCSLDRLEKDQLYFKEALGANAAERARKFITMPTKQPYKTLHQRVKLRAVSLFEPRPELNHANNALCIVGERSFSRNLFLDRRAFLNSYDYRHDTNGELLSGILNAVAPVCGGINLEYYFSRVDNQQLGAGTKLPHNVMGLIGVANGIDGDLRTGLPSQMIEVHDPYRLLVVVQQNPAIVEQAIRRNPATFQWFDNEWIRLVAYDPQQAAFFVWSGGQFEHYEPLQKSVQKVTDILKVIGGSAANFPVVELQNQAS